MLEDFLTFVNGEKMNLETAHTLLAVSGGVDSVVMVDLFSRAGFRTSIAHCNFGLRGEESDGDEEFVRVLSDERGFPFYSNRFDTMKYAALNKISIQMAARRLRYAWFEEVRRTNQVDYIATAHHGNDSIETVLLNLVRGTGLSGLGGINAQSGELIRPMLFATRANIELYANENGIHWREDRSNKDTHYQRNLIRHRVVPVLKEINPGLEQTFDVTLQRLKAANHILKDQLEAFRKSATEEHDGQMRIDLIRLRSFTESAYLLSYLLQPLGFNYHQCTDIIRRLNGPPGRRFYSDSHEVTIDREYLLVESVSGTSAQPGTFEVDYFERPAQQLIFPSIESGVFVDADLLIEPLEIRLWKEGDWFCPLGMNGQRKKVSDLLVDRKVPLPLKSRVQLLVNGNHDVIWIVGQHSDDRYKITANTGRIARIALI